MPLETATYINQLDSANPLGSDPIAAGDDHIRLIKSAVKATFPNITGPVNVTQAQINNNVPNALQKTGDTMSGPLVLSGNAANALEAVPKQQLDSVINGLGSMSSQNANNVNITGGTIAAAVLSFLYPVGSVYMNATNSTNPASLFGFGTWAAFGAGRVPVGFDGTNSNFNAAEKTGGAETVALTEAQMPKHYHRYITGALASGPYPNNPPGNQNGFFFGGTPDDAAYEYSTYSVGGDASSGSQGTGTSNGAPHTNLQPYITVYMWKRTA